MGEKKTDDANLLERIVTGTDHLRGWLLKAWRLGALMIKGAYTVGERRRLLGKLGEEVYRKIAQGDMKSEDLEPIVHQLDRLTKKIHIEEMLIQSIRFGRKSSRSQPQAKEEASTSKPSPAPQEATTFQEETERSATGEQTETSEKKSPEEETE